MLDSDSLLGKSFLAGEVICVYEGDFYRTKDAIRLKDKSYLMRLGPQCYVDALNRGDVPARYINDCRNPLLHNVYFDKKPEDRQAHVTAIRTIEKGEECLWITASDGSKMIETEASVSIASGVCIV